MTLSIQVNKSILILYSIFLSLIYIFMLNYEHLFIEFFFIIVIIEIYSMNLIIKPDGIFDMTDDYTYGKLFDGKAVFLNYWMMTGNISTEIKEHYDMTILPGRNEELSSASINGFNIGINKLLEITEPKSITNTEKLEAAIKVTEFLISKDLQKKLFVNRDIIASMPSLYEDEEVCSVNECELYKKMQPIVNRIYEINELSKEINRRSYYEDNFRKFAVNYLFNDDVDLEDTLRKIEDITKIYYIPLDSSLGFITVVLISVLAILMFMSLIFLFFENYQPFFEILSIDSWFILILGIVMILCSCLTSIGELTISKCHLKTCLLEMGIIIYLLIILYELIVNLSSEIILCEWIKKHKYLVLLFIFIIDILLSGLTLLNPYTIENIIVEDGFNYKTCEMKHTYGKLAIIIMSIEKLTFILCISFLIFVEWNMKKCFYEIRFIMFAIYSNLLLLLVSHILGYINVRNYYLNFIIQQSILIFISILSYTCSYGFKLFLALVGKKDLKIAFINRINENFINSTTSKTRKTVEDSVMNYEIEKTVEESNVDVIATNDITSEDNSNNNNQKRQTLYSKIISYHYSSFSTIDHDYNDKTNISS